MNDRALRQALEGLAPDVPKDAGAVLAEAKPHLRRARRRRRLRMAGGLAAAGLVAAGAVGLGAVLLDDATATPTPAAPADTNPPLTSGSPVPFTLDEIERG